MTTVRIAHTEPWPGRRLGSHGFRISSFLVVLVDDTGVRAIPVWLPGPEGHGLFRGHGDHSHPEPAEAITAELLRAADVTVIGVDIDELDASLTRGPERRSREPLQTSARVEFTAAGTTDGRQLTVRIGYALALATATGAPIQVADELMDRLAVPRRVTWSVSSRPAFRCHGSRTAGHDCLAANGQRIRRPADDSSVSVRTGPRSRPASRRAARREP